MSLKQIPSACTASSVDARENLQSLHRADAMCRWLPPFGFIGRCTTSTPGRGQLQDVLHELRHRQAQGFGGTYHELKPMRRFAIPTS